MTEALSFASIGALVQEQTATSAAPAARRSVAAGSPPIPLAGVAASLGWAAAVVLALAHLVGSLRQSGRRPHYDEAVFLHAGWLLRHGQHVYRDFLEAHTPALFVVAKWLLPGGTVAFPLLDLPQTLLRTRLLMLAVGSLAVAAVALLAFRVGSRRVAPAIVLAALLAPQAIWLRGIADFRADPPALLLFWGGALLLLLDRRSATAHALALGAGIGAVAVAAVVNPKWPLCTSVLGIVFLARLGRRPRSVLAALAAAVAALSAGLLWSSRGAPLQDVVVNAIRFNAAYHPWFAHDPRIARYFSAHPVPCPWPFRAACALPALALAAVTIAMPRTRELLDRRSTRIVITGLLLAAAAALEMRFLDPYPHLWPQYYLMWAFTLALLFGCVPALVATWAPETGRARLLAPLEIGFVVVATTLAVRAMAPRLAGLGAQDTRYYREMSYLQRRLQPGDEVWLQPYHHPIAARDSSYYWFGMLDLIPFSIDATRVGSLPWLPAVSESSLPMCQADQGLAPRLRFVTVNPLALRNLPETQACAIRLWQRGRLRPTPVVGVMELVSAGDEGR